MSNFYYKLIRLHFKTRKLYTGPVDEDSQVGNKLKASVLTMERGILFWICCYESIENTMPSSSYYQYFANYHAGLDMKS